MSSTPRAPRRTGAIVFVALVASLLWAGANPADAQVDVEAPRIVGGTQSAPKTWPSHAALLDNRTTGPASKAFYCGATVVNRSWVVTSAGCVLFENGERVPPALIDVLTGTQNLDRGGQRLHVAEIRILPGYDAKALLRSVAMIRLASPTTAPPQPLTAQGAPVPDGSRLVATGWGTTAFGQEVTVADLRQASLTKLADSVCARGFGTQFVPASQLCASGAGQDTCTHDDGGPLLTKRGTQWVLVGISRAGDGCGRHPVVYVRLSSFATWIRQQINPASLVTVSAKLSATKVSVGASVTVQGSVKPPKASASVVLQRKVGARWVDGGSARVDPTTGAFRLSLRPTAAGLVTLRVRTAGTTAVSPTLLLKVS